MGYLISLLFLLGHLISHYISFTGFYTDRKVFMIKRFDHSVFLLCIKTMCINEINCFLFLVAIK